MVKSSIAGEANLVLVEAGGRSSSLVMQFHRNLNSIIRNILHCQKNFSWVKRQKPTKLINDILLCMGEFIRSFPYGRMS